jgi:hypothetical protein
MLQDGIVQDKNGLNRLPRRCADGSFDNEAKPRPLL